MPDRLRPILAKIERAEEHFDDLRAECFAFLKSNGYQTIAYDDSETGDRVIKLRIVEDPPDRISIILGDAIHNLRSSLDYFAGQLVEAGGGTPTDDTAFPIFYNRKNFEAKYAGRIRGASQQALDLIRILEPYKGGNGDALWRLHMLDIIDKHRLLVTLAALNNMVTSHGAAPIPIQAFNATGHQFLIRIPGPLQDGVELFRLKVADRPQSYEDPQFHFQVGFGDIFIGQPILPTLHQLSKLVRRIIEDFTFLLI
jgi:hypothetical protein